LIALSAGRQQHCLLTEFVDFPLKGFLRYRIATGHFRALLFSRRERNDLSANDAYGQCLGR
jgi:hypothetical protein